MRRWRQHAIANVPRRPIVIGRGKLAELRVRTDSDLRRRIFDITQHQVALDVYAPID